MNNCAQPIVPSHKDTMALFTNIVTSLCVDSTLYVFLICKHCIIHVKF